MASMAEVAKPLGRYRWGICALLFFVITINYIDRQIIGVLKPVIEEDMGWSEVDYGNIVTAFQASYGIGLLVVGRWLDRVGTRKGIAIAIALWSLAACFHAAARSVLAFILARIALGVAESAAYPGAVKSIAEWFPKRERALGVGILNAGANVGVLLTPIIAIGIAGAYGWRSAFLVTGLIGFVVLWAWLRYFRQPADHPKVSTDERTWIDQDGEDAAGEPLGWKDAIRQRQAWFFICGKFFTDPVWYLFLFWLPDFLSKTQGMELFPKGDSGILATIGPALIGVYLLADIGSIAGGWLSSHLVGRGGAPGVQLQHLHHDRGYVPAPRGRDDCGHGRCCGRGRWYPDRAGDRLDSRTDRVLRAHRHLRGARLHDRLPRHPDAGAEDGASADPLGRQTGQWRASPASGKSCSGSHRPMALACAAHLSWICMSAGPRRTWLSVSRSWGTMCG